MGHTKTCQRETKSWASSRHLNKALRLLLEVAIWGLCLILGDAQPLTLGLEPGRCTENFIELNWVKIWGKRRQQSILFYVLGGIFLPISTFSLHHTTSEYGSQSVLPTLYSRLKAICGQGLCSTSVFISHYIQYRAWYHWYLLHWIL